MRSIKNQQDLGCFARTIFAPLPPKIYIMPLMRSALEDISKVWPLFDDDWIFHMIEEQYSTALNDCHSNSARWATINAILAIAVQWKAANNAVKDVFPISWSHFKNAFSIFPELVTQVPDFEACRAVLIMAIFMHGTADARTAHTLLTAAIQLAQVIGLYRRDLYLTTSPTENDRHMRVLWTINILGSNAAMKYGLRTPFDDGDDEMCLSSANAEASTGGLALPLAGVNILRLMAHLAAIQSKVHERLYSNVALRQEPIDRVRIVSQMDHQLEIWRVGLPATIRPAGSNPLTSIDLEPGVVNLHFAYYTTAWKIHMALQCPKAFHELIPPSMDASSVRGADWNIPLRSPTPVVGARVTLLVLQNMPSQPLVYHWQMLGYSVVAILTLVAAVLDDPSCPEALVNVRSVGEFINNLRRLQLEHGYELQTMILGLLEFYNVAHYVTRAAHDIPKYESAANQNENIPGLKKRDIQLALSRSADLMHVSQGFIGNMPVPCTEAAKIFLNTSDKTPVSNNGYGPFVPDVLKSQTYNFLFASRP
ncbi:hypothetical protein BKA67DRAFT_527318 [Truncatella angustata]|uniref:Xylanolytic transcriptional activator regulatory domain-containing protein n=1 Tax=Truncatella angustata TaxID=152316 RepID=A0A9P8RJY8_9PEZI|nr:uncharacterized protein BKA67DRAFT_527318 [Truncatella angustata]KAH6645451.1 hypothetical protein BKA67DRAFT_527318 [Truncatella angustata]